MARKNRVLQKTLTNLTDFNHKPVSVSESDNSQKRNGSAGTKESKSVLDDGHITSGGELSHLRGAKIYSVSEITKLIKDYLESNEDFRNIWLRGEITNFTLHSSGHMYFDLKDEKCVVSCVMFRSANQNLKFNPEHGLKILGFGNINVYSPQGRYQFVLSDMLPDGLGALHLAYLQLKDKLSKEGLFALEHKIPIPKFPKTIGVVTSPTGAAIRDIIRVATRRFPGINILIAPSKVQGDAAAEQLITGIERLHEVGGIDVIIIGRGGGSLEDLWPFNEEAVARAIYNATIPIISAVGHETDFTIADFTADARAPTPSTAAEIALPDMAELIQQIVGNIRQIKQLLDTKIHNYQLHLNRLLESPVFIRPTDRIIQYRQNLDSIISKISITITSYHKIKRSNLENILGKLTALDPKAILNRGYSMTLKLPDLELVSSVENVIEKDKLKLIMKDGEIKCEVKGKMKKENSKGM